MPARTLTTIRRRRSIDRHTIQARIIAESDRLVLLTPCIDFQFDGFAIINRSDIASRETRDSDRCHARIMHRQRGWPALPRYLRSIDLTDWQTTLRSIPAPVVIIEDERGHGDFLIGPIVAIGHRAVTVRVCDACGRWEDEESLPLSRITSCKFHDRYSATLAEHLVWGDGRPVGKPRAHVELQPAIHAGCIQRCRGRASRRVRTPSPPMVEQ